MYISIYTYFNHDVFYSVRVSFCVPYVPSSCMYACLQMLRCLLTIPWTFISSFHTPPPWGFEIYSLGILTLALPSFGV